MMAIRRLQTGFPLTALLEGFAALASLDDIQVTGLATDSRQVGPGDLFLAVSGLQHHGLDHACAAVAAGAVAVAWEPEAGRPELADLAEALAVPACAVPACAPGWGISPVASTGRRAANCSWWV
jgi:UDP-N-acetylmuramyl pentapeptide synthase